MVSNLSFLGREIIFLELEWYVFRDTLRALKCHPFEVLETTYKFWIK